MIVLLTAVLLLTGRIRGGSIPTPPYVPEYLPEGTPFGDCVSPYKAFKHKCILVAEYPNPSPYFNTCLFTEFAYVDLIESDEERQFFFDEIFGGEVNYVYQLATGSPSNLLTYYDTNSMTTPTDYSYLASKIIDSGNGITDYNCTITKNDMSCVTQTGMPSAYGACTYARPAYDKDPRPCSKKITKKLRRDSPRKIQFDNDEADICYLTIKGKRRMKPSMVKIYGYSSMCPTGFLVSSNTDLKIDVMKLPPFFHCGKKSGLGRVLQKKLSGKGKEVRIYVVLNGDGMPMTIKTKGKAFV